MTKLMENLLSKILAFSEQNQRTVTQINVCKELSTSIRKFHWKTKTLQNSLTNSLKKLTEKQTIVLETAHQPNFLPYSGIFKKVILLEHIARSLEKKGCSVVCLFSIVDTDFADDEWFASNRFPHLSTSGYLKVGIKIAKKDRKKCMYAIQKPSQETWENIVKHIQTHYETCLGELEREFSSQNISDFKQSIEIPFQKKWSDLVDLLEDAYQNAENFADMNAIILSKIINDLMNCSTVFFKYSDGLNAFEESFSRLLSCSTDYITLYNRFADQYNLDKILKDYAPFWYHCKSCEGKVPLQQRGNQLEEKCLSCKTSYSFDFKSQENPNLSGIAKRISPRAIPRHYITFDGLGVSFYAGGQAGSLYTSIAEKIAGIIDFRFPPIFTWFNKDHYTGVLQFNAYSQIHRVLKLNSYNQFLLKYGELNTQTIREVEELNHQIESWESEKNSLKNNLSELENKTIRNQIISNLREISNNEKKLKTKIQQTEHKITVLNNSVKSFRIFPSIIDYLVNMDALSIAEQWHLFLSNTEPPFAQPQFLKTVFSKFLRSKFSWCIDIENNVEHIASLM